jgi:hypothetical protein
VSSLRGTAIGSILGVLPGTGPVIASFASCGFEKKLTHGAALGSGAIEGIAGPESANNAAGRLLRAAPDADQQTAHRRRAPASSSESISPHRQPASASRNGSARVESAPISTAIVEWIG